MGIHTRRRPRLSFVAVLGHSVAGSGTKCFSASRCRCFVGQSHLVVDDGSGTKYPSANPRHYLLGQSHRVVDMDPASACFPQRKFASSWSSPQANFLLTLFCWESLLPPFTSHFIVSNLDVGKGYVLVYIDIVNA